MNMFTQKQLLIGILGILLVLLVGYLLFFNKEKTYTTPDGSSIKKNDTALTIKDKAVPKKFIDNYKDKDKTAIKGVKTGELAQKAWLIEWAIDNKKINVKREVAYKNSDSFNRFAKLAEKELPKKKAKTSEINFNSGYVVSSKKKNIIRLSNFTKKNINKKDLAQKLLSQNKEYLNAASLNIIFDVKSGAKNYAEFKPKYIKDYPENGEVSKILSQKVERKDIDQATELQKEDLKKLEGKVIYWFFYKGNSTFKTDNEATDWSVLEKYRKQTTCIEKSDGIIC